MVLDIQMTELTTIPGETPATHISGTAPEALALVIVWAAGEPSRIGEVAIVPSTRAPNPCIVGRGPADPADPGRRLDFARHRAGVLEVRPPLHWPTISRRQLLVRAKGLDLLEIENVGRAKFAHNGTAVASAEVRPGDTLRVGAELLLLCVRRPAWLRPAGELPAAMPFGLADPSGWVGESPSAWEHRRRIALLARANEHVLIVGESGTGKEHTARALHALSSRAKMPFVARSAATLPEGIIDAELFGHARNYPNAGMPERVGVVGQADGGTLFLDEVAELPYALQTHLLRVLDGGEYQRLGENLARISDFRLLAATNHPDRLRPELAARLKVTLQLPGLNERAEDIPLVALHLLRKIASRSAEAAARILPDADPSAPPRVSLRLIEQLVRHRYTTHVRELERALWTAVTESRGDVLDVAPGTPGPAAENASLQAASPPVSPGDVSAGAIARALAENNGNIERTWRALGLASRHVLTRLMAKHQLRRPLPGGATD